MALAVNRCFEAEGLPRRIKIDNGRPLAHPQDRNVPTLTVLWWVGLGIEVVYNKPSCPQQNGTVEGLQGICCRWSSPVECANIGQLQMAVDEANRIQRSVFLVPRKDRLTREQLYPQLATNPRKYDPKTFCFNKVGAYLAQKVWAREVKKNGCISLFGSEIFVSETKAGSTVTVTYDPQEKQWLVSNSEGHLLKPSKRGLITEEMILNHVNMSKNEGTTSMPVHQGST